jgi:hypothetical protein
MRSVFAILLCFFLIFHALWRFCVSPRRGELSVPKFLRHLLRNQPSCRSVLGARPFQTDYPGLLPGLSPEVPSSFVILNYGGKVRTKIRARSTAALQKIERWPRCNSKESDSNELAEILPSTGS